MKLIKALLTAALCTLLLSSSAAAQLPVSENPRIDELLKLAGEDLKVRELSWMVPGARIVFDATLSSLADPDESYDYWMVCDIFAVTDDGLVGLTITNSLLENGEPFMREGGGSIFERQSASILWFNPDILSAISSLPGNKVASAGKKLIAGSWQSAYTLQGIGPSGYVSETSYSAETGILLSDEYVAVDESGKALMHSSLEYKGYRQGFTGLEDYAQTAIRKGTKLQYKIMAEYNGNQLDDVPIMNLILSAEEVGSDWVLYKVESYDGGELTDMVYIAESYRFLDNSCSYYPPEWLKGLAPGALLSEDDLIGSTISVIGMKDTPQGKILAIMGREGQTETVDEYDIETGFLVRSTVVILDAGLSIIQELSEVQHEDK